MSQHTINVAIIAMMAIALLTLVAIAHARIDALEEKLAPKCDKCGQPVEEEE